MRPSISGGGGPAKERWRGQRSSLDALVDDSARDRRRQVLETGRLGRARGGARPRARRRRGGLTGGELGLVVQRVRVRFLQRAEPGHAQRVACLPLPRARDLHRRRRTAPAATASSRPRGPRAASPPAGASIPLYVGLQAPCVDQSGLAKITPALAASQGTAAADDAVNDSAALALPAGSPIYFDIEGYALNDPACTAGGAGVRRLPGSTSSTRSAISPASTAAPPRRSGTCRRSRRPGPLPTTSGSPTGTASRASSATRTCRTRSGRTTSGSTSTGAAHAETWGGVTLQSRLQLRRRRRRRYRRSGAA